MRQMYLVCWNKQPIFAFDTKEQAEEYIRIAIANAQADWEYNIMPEAYSRENFYVMSVMYWL